MDEQELQLVEPDCRLRDEYLAYIDDFRHAGEDHHAENRDMVLHDFEAFLARCRDHAAGRNLDPGYVPQTTFWLVRQGRLLGTCRLRHRLNDSLSQHGGNIGYDVRPTERGKGYATRMLAMVLDKARQLGLARAMLTCDKDNAASACVIVRNGGRLDRESWWEEDGRRVLIQNYWIDL